MLVTGQDGPIISADPARVEEVELSWRRRLVASLHYLRDHFAAAGQDYQGDLTDICDRVAAAPVSPWVFCLYSKLVAAATKSDIPALGSVIGDLKRAAMSYSAEYDVIVLDDEAVPHSWWEHFRQLLDTDRARAFEAVAPTADDAARCRREIADALTLLSRVAPDWALEMQRLLRLVVLGSPTGRGNSLKFDAVSSFFLNGVVLANAGNRKTPIGMIDMLVHETSHILLFGLTVDEALTTDRGTQRYSSPVRKDPRPIEGIFHASFVATRVYVAMSDMLKAGTLTPEETTEAIDRRDRNGRAARQALDTIREHASPTSFGDQILGGLSRFWAAQV